MFEIKKKWFIGTFILAIYFSSVTAQGINFEKALTWQQVKEKAGKENKYIFVDCMATWCRPCQQMEKEVYPAEKVGKFFNDNFISVKLQMDSTQKDDSQVRGWYSIAAAFKQQYKITVYPTFLYFSQDGKILTKSTGFQNEDELIAAAGDVFNPSKQYYTLLENYRQGKKDYITMPKLATTAQNFNDTAIAWTIARDYINNYLPSVKEQDLYTEENIAFIQEFLTTQERYFNLFYLNRDKIDNAVKHKGYAQSVVDFLLYKEMIMPHLLEADKNNSQPNWNKIEIALARKYNKKDAAWNISTSKLKWYEYKAQWQQYGEAATEHVKQYKENLGYGDLNHYAWTIFLNSHDTTLLKIALDWSTYSIETAPDRARPVLMDTKANLLYKLGNNQEAIMQEEKAIALAQEQKAEATVREYQKNITKMKDGKPTWVIAKK